jgi:hypothetical protein
MKCCHSHPALPIITHFSLLINCKNHTGKLGCRQFHIYHQLHLYLISRPLVNKILEIFQKLTPSAGFFIETPVFSLQSKFSREILAKG